MNHIPNFKIEQISKNLTEIDLKLANYSLEDDELQIRALIDSRRQLLKELETNLTEHSANHLNKNKNVFSTNPKAENFINSWCERVKNADTSFVNFKTEEFCNLFIDCALPKKWHFGYDVAVVISPPSLDIIKALKSRDQNHIVVYCASAETAALQKKCQSFKNIHFCTSINAIERAFALLQSPAQQVITITCEMDQPNLHETTQNIADAVNTGKKTRFENTRTVSKFGISWATNVLKNLPALANAKNLHQLNVTGVEDAVVVASGPSLNKNVDVLCEIQDKVFIVTALRSLPVLNAAGVTPDLVIQLDAEDDEVAKKLSPDPKHPIKHFLFEPIVNPGFLKVPAEITIWSLAQHFFDIHQKFGTKPTPFNVPSVSIYGLSLCHHLKFKNICFIGQDLAAHEGKQYADGATDLLPAHAKMSMFNIEVPGFNGGTVMTRNSFNYQIKRCAEIAREWKKDNPEINLVNATEGGAFIDGFAHMSLHDFASSRNLNTCRIKKHVWFTEETTMVDSQIASFRSEVCNTMDRIITLANHVVKLDQKSEKTRGLQKKIERAVQKFKTLNNNNSLLQIAMQDNIAKIIGTSENAQKIDTYAEFFEKINHCAKALKVASKS